MNNENNDRFGRVRQMNPEEDEDWQKIANKITLNNFKGYFLDRKQS